MTSEDAATREWFHQWFGEEYLALYPHRDEKEAREAVALYRRLAPPIPGSRVLDLACGGGRHLRELRSAGFDSIGLDLSATLLRAAHLEGPNDPLVRADMRGLPFEDRSFGGLTSFFTSFGYFADPADDRRVLREIARVLRPAGTFMLDFLNAARVRSELVAEDHRVVAGERVIQRREIVGGMVVKRIHMQTLDGRDTRTFEERVRLYRCDELVSLLSEVDLTVEGRLGDYEGGAYGPQSPRLILAGRRPDRERSEA
jgi:SAM-dependent methyltransferase